MGLEVCCGDTNRSSIGPAQCESIFADLNDKAGAGTQNPQADARQQPQLAQPTGKPVGPGNFDDDGIASTTPFGKGALDNT
ncbi:MAG: hypothetical protein O2782_08455 [bacterium]|nr:hypothetical protein [bacterium]